MWANAPQAARWAAAGATSVSTAATAWTQPVAPPRTDIMGRSAAPTCLRPTLTAVGPVESPSSHSLWALHAAGNSCGPAPTPRRRRSHVISATGAPGGLREAALLPGRAMRRPSPSGDAAPEQEAPPPASAANLLLPRTRTRRRPSSADSPTSKPKLAERGMPGDPGGAERGGDSVEVANPADAQSGGRGAAPAESVRRLPASSWKSPQPRTSPGPAPEPAEGSRGQRRQRRTRAPGDAAPEDGKGHPHTRRPDGGAPTRSRAPTPTPTPTPSSSNSSSSTASARGGGRRAAHERAGGPQAHTHTRTHSHSHSHSHTRPARIAGAGGAAGRRGPDVAGGGRNAWRMDYLPQPLAADLPSFAAAVRAEAASWHPLQISAALNHTVNKLRGALGGRSKRFLRVSRDGGGAAAAAAAEPPATAPRGHSPRDTNSNSNSNPGSHSHSPSHSDSDSDPDVAADAELRQVLDRLHSALLPYIPTMLKPRYATNALWVCAKTGYWGAPGSGFLAALLQRLRDRDYALLQDPSGHTHASLWWALSEHEQQQLPQAAGQAGGQAVVETAVAETEAAAARRLREGGSEGGGSEGGGEGRVAGGMDLLRASAAVIKAQKALDAASFTPQGLCNILLGAARLKYSGDPEFVQRLVEALVEHPGPLVPQDVSNAVYALGELYGAEDEEAGAVTLTLDGPSLPTGAATDDATEGLVSPAGSGAAAEPTAPTAPTGRLPPALAPHLRELARVSLDLGLRRFNTQALSNTLYGLARLEVRLGGDDRAGNEDAPAASANADNGDGDGDDDDDGAAQQAPAQGPEQRLPETRQAQRREPPAPAPAPAPAAAEGLLSADPAVALRQFVVLLAEHMRDRIRREPRECKEQDLGNTTWALASAGYTDQSYYLTAVHAATVDGCMDHATPQSWAMFMWALVEVKFKPPPALGQLLHRSVCTGRERWARDIRAWSSLPWDLVGLSMFDDEVLAAVGGFAAASGCVGMRPNWLSRSLWALAVMPEGGLRRHRVMAAVLAEAINRHGAMDYGQAGLTQLWQAHVELEAAFNDQPPTATATARHGLAPATAAAPGAAPRGSRRGNRRGAGSTNNPGTADPAAATPTTPTAVTEDGLAAQEVAVPRLHPSLVAAARKTMLDNSSRISVETVTTFQRAVYKGLCGLMGQTAGQPQEQGQEQPQAQEQPQGQQQQQPAGRRRRIGAQRTSATGTTAGGSSGSSSSSPPSLSDAEDDADADGGGKATAGEDGDGGAGAGTVVVRVEAEWLVEPLALRVDACVWLSDGRVVVVEADGPSHFFANEPETRRPNTALRDRQLARVFGGGDNVKSVPHWEWDGLRGGAAGRRAYLARLLGL
ncbi:hypothetical protein PLESTF_001611100 [Pleodorina starrii]|nr:hypothetical protein PLESTF_001611100 [Pleodorina starrii]